MRTFLHSQSSATPLCCFALQVTNKKPLAFLMHAKDDDVVTVKNSVLFYEALKKNNNTAEIFLYEKGGHGFGMNNKTSEIKWMDKVEEWFKKQGWLMQ